MGEAERRIEARAHRAILPPIHVTTGQLVRLDQQEPTRSGANKWPEHRMAEMRKMSQPESVSIRATCPDCGDVDLTVDRLRAQLCVTDNRGSYAFRCPGCETEVERPADPGVVDLLVSAGVELSVWKRADEDGASHSGPAFTWDDVLSLHDELERPDWIERLVAWAPPTA